MTPVTAASHAAELAIGNIVRRVLHVIREEEQQEQLEQSEGSSTPGDGGKGLQVGASTSRALQLLMFCLCSSRGMAAKDHR
jgi:hypothetical protein